MENSEGQNLPPYRVSAAVVLKRLGTSEKQGLDDAEAAKRLTEYGSNALQQVHRESLLRKYLRQFKDLMIILLIFSSILSFILDDARTGIVLIVLILFNTIVGFGQEFKAERIMESLEKLVVSTAKAIRGGKLTEVTASELVPGDIVYIEEGDSVPADLRMITESELGTNDFALTGESQPSRKFTHAIEGDVELANRHNLVFMGTTVATGHGYGVVVGTGMHTELGRIASLSEDTTADLSPLQKELNHTATRVTQGTVVLCALMLPIAIQADLGIKDAFLFAIGIASSLIPQGLPAEINTTLAQAANKLAKARALVKKLSAVETLGATSIICTDKTGTLTENQMTVQHLLIGKTEYDVTGNGYEANGKIVGPRSRHLSKEQLADISLLLSAGAMASNARINPPDAEHPTWYCLGDPTEGALITLARKGDVEPDKLNKKYPELKEFSFDSARKRMSSIRAWGDGKQIYLFMKGAPESVLEKSTELWDHGHVRKLTAADKKRIMDHHTDLAEQAMRNIGIAYRVLPKNTDLKKLTMEDAEENMVFLGIASMIDPLRDEVPEAMQAAHAAHINVSVITGDFAITAEAIAKKAHLAESGQRLQVVSGEELRKLDDREVLHLATRGGVIFSRVAPEDKLRIVSLVKASGLVVAVTGDGINDAPALKKADIGVAMGKTGTDVAKQSAEIVLLDDSFHTLVGAVQQGRVIFNNIRKGTLSCFTSNSAELVVNLISLAAVSLFHVPLALTVMQILAIDLVAELFPIAALGWDKEDSEVMTEEPRDPRKHILNKHTITDLLWCGLIIGGLAFANYIFFFMRNGIDAQGLEAGSIWHMKATALTYLTIVLCQLVNILQRRSSKGLFTKYQLHNGVLWSAVALSLMCVFIIIYNPWVAPYFGAAPLGIVDWLFAIAAAVIFLSIRELQRYTKDNNHTRDHVLALHYAKQAK